MTIKENRTIVTIKKVTEEDKGTYVCKATSEAGLAVTKATLYCSGDFKVILLEQWTEAQY